MSVNIVYQCYLCKKIIDSKKSNLLRHFKLAHISSNYFLCPVVRCGITFKTRYNLQSHYQTIHGKNTLPRNLATTTREKKFSSKFVKTFKCDLCNKIFRHRKSNLMKHIKNIHQSDLPKISCTAENCDLMFYSVSNMERHLGRVHGKYQRTKKIICRSYSN